MSVINQKDYLKKYLKIGKQTGKKKKRKDANKISGKGLKIIDDDIYTNLSEEIQVDIDAANEDAPQIVAVIDDRPPSMRIDEKTKSRLWQPIGEPSRNDNDLSPPRRKDKDISPLRRKDKDLSPPRRKDKDLSPSRRKDKDLSPPRRKDKDLSPPRRKDKDLSPPRKKDKDLSPTRRKDKDLPPPRNKEQDLSPPRITDKDLSPPRRKKDLSPLRRKDQDHSPPRRKDKDLSPTRRKRKDIFPHRSNDQDLSPPRKKNKDHSQLIRNDQDLSPLRRKNHSSLIKNEQDLSPPRKKDKTPLMRNDQDLSPPRRKNKNISSPRRKDQNYSPPRKERDQSPERKKYREVKRKASRWENNDVQSKPEVTLSGKKSGLQNAQNLVEDLTRLQKQEEEMFRTMSADISGANAATVIRKKKQEKIIDPEKEARDKELKEKYSVWGKGLKQVQDETAKYEDQLKEMDKPLARYADDEDLEKYLKEQEREGDPMLAYIRKKKKKVAVEQGVPEKPMYMGDFMPNRYGIRPGYRWDGVDRSNGYESKWFQTQNSKKAMQDEALMWSTEDM